MRAVVVSAFALAARAAHAQSGPELEWAPVLELRARALASEGLVEGEAMTLAQRARVGVEVQRGWLSARVSFQEVRAWTRAEGAVSGDFTPGLAEGWARMAGDLSDNVGARVTVGRQPIRVNEGRLLGDREWEMEGQLLDALRVEAWARPLHLEYVNARRFAEVAEDPLGFGVNVVRLGVGREQPLSRWQVDALSVVDARDTVDLTTTTGLYTRLDLGRWRSSGELYVQTNPDGVGTLGAGNGGWVFGPDEEVVLRLAGAWRSGDPDDAGSIAPWRPLWGDTHRFHGLLDLFAEAPTTGTLPGDRGLADLAVLLEGRPWRAVRWGVGFHDFASSVDAERYGSELDLGLTWWFSPFGALDAGYAHFFPAPGFRDAAVDWGYLDLDVAF